MTLVIIKERSETLFWNHPQVWIVQKVIVISSFNSISQSSDSCRGKGGGGWNLDYEKQTEPLDGVKGGIFPSGLGLNWKRKKNHKYYINTLILFNSIVKKA